MFKFEDLLTKEEIIVLNAVVTNQLHTIENGNVKRINKLLNKAKNSQ